MQTSHYPHPQETLTVDALVDQVVDLLTGTPAQHLLPVFGGFLPKRARPQFNLRIAYVVYVCMCLYVYL